MTTAHESDPSGTELHPRVPASAAPANEDGDVEAQRNVTVAPIKRSASVEMLARAKGPVFSFDKATYDVWIKTETGKKKKRILDNVSGVVHPGEVLAVMGPSGSGKTTLLDFLADRLETGERTGEIRTDGDLIDRRKFKHLKAYVHQEDALIGSLTVFETLMFSAELTLPPSMSPEEKRQRVIDVIGDMGLDVCRDAPIGTVFKKGISGGQKRRVSIALELISSPSLLFLDEPTSGLDAASAYYVMKIIKNLASQGRTVICTIHQPSSETFALMDKLLLLSRGQSVFLGDAQKVTEYFGELGHPCPQYTNPADFALNLVNTDFEGHADVDGLVEAYTKSDTYAKVSTELEDLKSGKAMEHKIPMVTPRSYPVTWSKMLYELSKRAMINNVRNPGVYWVRIVMYTMLSIMIGTLYLNIGDDQKSVQDRVAVLFFIAAFMVFMSIAVLPIFLQEREVFLHERSNGRYGVLAYVMANTITGLPGLFAIAMISSAIVYPLIGLRSGADRFFIFTIDLFLSLYCAEGLMLLVSAVVPMFIMGIAMAAGLYGMFMLVQGFFINKSNIPVYYKWLTPVGFHTYSLEMFMYNEFDGATFNAAAPFDTGENVLKFYEMEDTKIWVDVIVLIAMSLIYRLMFYFVLRKYHTGRR